MPLDERSLRELELLAVTRLYGLAGGAAPAPAEPRRDDEAKPARPARPAEGKPASRPAEPREASPPAGGSREQAPRDDVATMDWEALRETVRECRRCGLCAQRKQAVFGVGDPAATWLFVGEGPGADEDEKGEPFVGQAGRLLDSMLAALRLARGREVYIANVVKCRPPGNRVPTPEEAAACAPYLDRQIDLIAPRIIVALGKTAAVRLTGAEGSLGGLRGRVHDYRGIPLVITYHPAYLLRNLPDKAKAWEDLLFARRTLAARSA